MIAGEHQPYDKSSKWLIQHHGDSMLRLAKVARIAAWRPAQAEVVQPRQLPDGLLEVRLEDEPQDDLFLIESIEQHAPPGEKANLLAVTRMFSFLRYNDLGLLTILGGKNVMLEVPFLDEIVREKTREAAQRAARETARSNIAAVLEARFGDVPRDVADEIEVIDDEKQLGRLVRAAGSCPDLEAFRKAITRG